MKCVVLLLVVISFVCLSFASDNCYRLGPVTESCNSNEARLKVIRGPPGKTGADGKDGKPCAGSQEQLKNLGMLANGLTKNMNDRSNAFNNEMMNKIKTINNTIADKTNSGSGSGSSNGGEYGEANPASLRNNRDVKYELVQTWYKHTSTHYPRHADYLKKRGGIPTGVVMEHGVVVRKDAIQANVWGDLARIICKEKGGEFGYRDIDTLEKRKHLLRQLFGPAKIDESTPSVAVGMEQKGGVWYYDNGVKVNMATFGTIKCEYSYIRNNDCWKRKCAYIRYNGEVYTTYCTYYGAHTRHYTLCEYPYRISFYLPGKQTAFKEKLNFEQARSFCYKKGGRIALASIKTHKKLRNLVKSAKVTDGEYWIGVMKIWQTAFSYQYIDEHKPVDESFPWLPNYPKFERFTEQCAVLSVKKSKIGIINKSCDTQLNVICEYST